MFGVFFAPFLEVEISDYIAHTGVVALFEFIL